MFKLLFTAIMLLVIFIAGSSYVLYLKKGTQMLPEFSSATDNIKMPTMPSLPSLEILKLLGDDVDLPALLQELQDGGSEESAQDKPAAISAPSGPSYKWFQNGSWHYGDKPPKNVTAIDLSDSET